MTRLLSSSRCSPKVNRASSIGQGSGQEFQNPFVYNRVGRLLTTLGLLASLLRCGRYELHSQIVESRFEEVLLAIVEVPFGLLFKQLKEVYVVLSEFEVTLLIAGDGVFHNAKTDQCVGRDSTYQHIETGTGRGLSG